MGPDFPLGVALGVGDLGEAEIPFDFIVGGDGGFGEEAAEGEARGRLLCGDGRGDGGFGYEFQFCHGALQLLDSIACSSDSGVQVGGGIGVVLGCVKDLSPFRGLPQRLKPQFKFPAFTARLKPCPDTNRLTRALKHRSSTIALFGRAFGLETGGEWGWTVDVGGGSGV